MKILTAALSGPGHGHPMLALSAELARRGHAVTFLTGSAHRSEAGAADCSFIEMPVVFGSTSDRLRPYEDSEALARACIPLVEQVAPDLAVVDLLTFGPALAAEATGVPWASLLIHGLHTWSVDLLPFGMGRAPARGVGRLGDALIRRLHLRDLKRACDDANAVRGRLGLPPVIDRLDPQLSGALQLVATLPSLEVPRSDWPARAHIVGPCLWPSVGVMPEVPPGDAPLVLVAPSTAHDGAKMARASIEAVVAAGARGVVSLGATTDAGPLPEQVRAAPTLAHDTVIPRCAAVVCNGGHGVVARALRHGVPVVVVPGHGDQRENGFRVQRAGAGLLATPGSVGTALRRVLREETFARRARDLAIEAQAWEGPARAAALIEEMGSAPRRPGATVTDG